MHEHAAPAVMRMTKPAFTVIGQAGSTDDGDGFIARLWEIANARFPEITHLVRTDENGVPVGIWGCMTDMSGQFLPWEDSFSRGRYLAGAECRTDAVVPHGWTVWSIPGFVYLMTENADPDTFSRMLAYLSEQNIPLVGAVQEYTQPASGKSYLCFPVERL